MTMLIRSITDIGNDRNYNDDSCYYDERKELMVMADGMGGYSGGRVASAIAVKIFQTHYMGITEETYQQDLKDLFMMCNQEIISAAKRNENYKEMGTTLTVLCFHEDRYYIGHVGDSRAYLCRGGKLTRLTNDHNLVGELLKSGQISKKDAQHHPGKNMLTRVVGRNPLSEIDFYTGEARKDDLYLLC
ncbi:MAG: protein phosphatase 2C domain-containing protein, partial [Clostridia bacterium]